MQADPIQEWQRLTEHYREMSDDELHELADDIGNLTETAQQVLRSEMRSRGLGEMQASNRTPEKWWAADAFRSPESKVRRNSDPIFGGAAAVFGNHAPETVPETPGAEDEDAGQHEYTWKTVLCDCDTNGQAKELSSALQRAGIDSWIQQSIEFGRSYARVLVAADQLDQARAIAAQPIPQEIVDESTEVPEFVEPKCPKCGSDDVVLKGVDPRNTWQCEQCGEQWTEPDGSEADDAPAD
jgi:ribosomal protein S27E